MQATEPVKPAPTAPDFLPPLGLALPAALPARPSPKPSSENRLEMPLSKKRPREALQSDPQQQQSEASLQSESSPHPAVKRRRTLQVLTPVTEQTSGAEREESLGITIGAGDQTGGTEVMQNPGVAAVEPVTEMEEPAAEEEFHVAAQEEIPTQHSGIFGAQGGQPTETALSELEYKMLRLENNVREHNRRSRRAILW